MNLFVTNDADSMVAELLTRYLKLDQRFKVSITRIDKGLVQAGLLDNAVMLVGAGQKYRSLKVVLKQLTALCNLDDLLLGETAEEVNEISKHFDLWHNPIEELVKFYNQDLLTKTYLEKEHLTVADLVVFCKLHSFVVAMEDVPKVLNNNLLRWFNHIQHLPALHEVLQQMGRELVLFPVKVSKKQLKKAEKEGEKDKPKEMKKDQKEQKVDKKEQKKDK